MRFVKIAETGMHPIEKTDGKETIVVYGHYYGGVGQEKAFENGAIYDTDLPDCKALLPYFKSMAHYGLVTFYEADPKPKPDPQNQNKGKQ